jgi:hypothetical protein
MVIMVLRISSFALVIRDIQFHSNHSEMDWRVTLTDTGKESQTGARVKKIEK